MLIDHPPRRPRPVISPSFLFHLSYPSTPSPFFLRISSQLRASSLAFYRVGVAEKLPRRIVSSSLLSTFLPSFFFISPRFSILATPSNASILRSYSRSDFQLWDYACLFFFLFFEKNLQDCKKCILECIARSRRGSVVVPSPDRGTSRPSSALSRHKR